MSQTLQLIQQLIARGEIRISEHGYDELAADNISVQDLGNSKRCHDASRGSDGLQAACRQVVA